MDFANDNPSSGRFGTRDAGEQGRLELAREGGWTSEEACEDPAVSAGEIDREAGSLVDEILDAEAGLRECQMIVVIVPSVTLRRSSVP